MKRCSNPNCKQVNPQPLDNFNKRGEAGKGHIYRSRCKSCASESVNKERKSLYDKGRYLENGETVRAQVRAYSLNNKDKISERNKRYRFKNWKPKEIIPYTIPEEKKCPNCQKVKKLNEFGNHKGRRDGHSCYCLSCCRDKHKVWRDVHPDAIAEHQAKSAPAAKAYGKKYYLANKEKCAASCRRYAKDHKKETNDRHMSRYHNDINYRLRHRLRGRINSVKLTHYAALFGTRNE